MNESGDQRSLIDLLAEEFLERKRRGEEPSVAEYAVRFPELGDDIRKVFRAIAMIESLKPGSKESIDAISPVIPGGRGAIPERLGDFRILRFVAEGGMGYVFEAEQESMNRHVAPQGPETPGP